MWFKLAVSILLFYILSVLQNSFFSHFNIMGQVPNLVFLLYFVLIFFTDKNRPVFCFETLFYAVAGGVFMDVFAYAPLGISTAILLLINFITKKLQSLLKDYDDAFPVLHFVVLFSAGLIFYEVIMQLYMHFIDPLKLNLALGWNFWFGIAYTLAFALPAYYVYKGRAGISKSTRQMKLL